MGFRIDVGTVRIECDTAEEAVKLVLAILPGVEVRYVIDPAAIPTKKEIGTLLKAATAAAGIVDDEDEDDENETAPSEPAPPATEGDAAEKDRILEGVAEALGLDAKLRIGTAVPEVEYRDRVVLWNPDKENWLGLSGKDDVEVLAEDRLVEFLDPELEPATVEPTAPPPQASNEKGHILQAVAELLGDKAVVKLGAAPEIRYGDRTVVWQPRKAHWLGLVGKARTQVLTADRIAEFLEPKRTPLKPPPLRPPPRKQANGRRSAIEIAWGVLPENGRTVATKLVSDALVAVGMSRGGATVALARLQQEGKAEKVGRGFWRRRAAQREPATAEGDRGAA